MHLIVDGPVMAKKAAEQESQSRATRAIPPGNERQKRPHDPVDTGNDSESQPRSAKRVTVESDGVIGVLNDWGLATAIPPSGTSNTDRAGAIPFMALQPLKGKRVAHMFQHDVQSFLWVFLWVCGCSNGSKTEVLVAPYKRWRKLDMLACEKERLLFLCGLRFKDISISKHHAPNNLFCLFLATLLHPWMNIPTSVDHDFQEQKDMAFIQVLLPEFREVRTKLNRRFLPKVWFDDELYNTMPGYIYDTANSIIKSYQVGQRTFVFGQI